MPNIARCKPIFSRKRSSQTNERVALCSAIRIYNGKNTRFYRVLAASVEIKRASAWPPFDRPIVYIVASCGRTSSVWNILIGFVVWETRAILSKSWKNRKGFRIFSIREFILRFVMISSVEIIKLYERERERSLLSSFLWILALTFIFYIWIKNEICMICLMYEGHAETNAS